MAHPECPERWVAAAAVVMAASLLFRVIENNDVAPLLGHNLAPLLASLLSDDT